MPRTGEMEWKSIEFSLAFQLPGFPATASLRYMRSFVTQSALLIPLDRPLLPGYILN
jgi:hypothetical protein